MADKPINLDSMEEALHRLSKKPGVRAWLMLDRANGSVLKTNGQVAQVRPPKQSHNPNSSNNTATVDPSIAVSPTHGSFSTDVAVNSNNETQAAQELASMVWGFLSAAGSLVDEMDTEDELKLLRLRTKKQELVIVPEVKYLLVVIHDTPPV
ncbi:hypothetical protein F5Y15DRAFT_398368 [Xylariaceae sp. FL0016]|nr:hypothetical protein F5Y15DRAFT_398368 [Xylariaceae sp. FL0016]